VNASAWAHRMSPVVFGDPTFDHRDHQRRLGYGQCKTAEHLWALSGQFSAGMVAK
jgi:hypothetical protein